MEVKAVLMKCNTPNRNGRIYDKDMVEKCIKKMKIDTVKNGPILGEVSKGDGVYRPGIMLKEVSHKINDLYFEGDDLKADMSILDTPMGNYVKNVGIENFGCEVVCTGEIRPDNTAKIKSIERFDLIDKPLCAWEESCLVEKK